MALKHQLLFFLLLVQGSALTSRTAATLRPTRERERIRWLAWLEEAVEQVVSWRLGWRIELGLEEAVEEAEDAAEGSEVLPVMSAAEARCYAMLDEALLFEKQ